MSKSVEKRPGHESVVRLRLARAGCYLALILLTLICLLPIVMLMVNATRAHVDIQRAFSLMPGANFAINLQNVLNNQTILIARGMINSLIVSTLSTLFCVYFSALTAYALHVYHFRGRDMVFNFILLIMTIPTQVGALGFVEQMTAMGLKDTFIPLILPAIAAPSCVFFMKQYIEGALPLEIVEAARIDGSGEFHTFNTIITPILKPALAVQAIFSFVASWNNYFTPALILTKAENKTLPLWIAFLRSADFTKFDMGQLYMMLAFSIFPVVVVYLLLSKFIVKGVTLGSVKG